MLSIFYSKIATKEEINLLTIEEQKNLFEKLDNALVRFDSDTWQPFIVVDDIRYDHNLIYRQEP